MSDIRDSADQKEEPKTTEIVTKREIPINRIIPEDLPMEFSDGMVVKQQGGMFYMYFFQSKPPLALTLEEVEQIKEIDAVCIAQILVTPEQMEKNIKALTSNFEKAPTVADLMAEKDLEKD